MSRQRKRRRGLSGVGQRAKRRFKLRHAGSACEGIYASSLYVKDGFIIGKVCKRGGGWTYQHVGPFPETEYGPVSTKTLALRKAIKGYKSWIG